VLVLLVLVLLVLVLLLLYKWHPRCAEHPTRARQLGAAHLRRKGLWLLLLLLLLRMLL
jgi:predicted MFS family arabinose efflux permease